MSIESTSNDQELIKTFLKLRNPRMVDKPYYSVDLSRNIFTLFDADLKSPSAKSLLFETDKIFTEQHENSYIYEEICRDCITDSLNGNNFLYVGYGIASSDKQNVLIGNVEDSHTNIAHRGLIPRLVSGYLNRKEINEKNLTLTMSYMCVNDSKVIDLSRYMGKDISNVTEKDLISSAMEIKNKDTLASIKKVQVMNDNDVAFFINKILNAIMKIDPNSQYRLYSWSHFVFVMYINDNNGKQISSITFVMLSGNDSVNDASTSSKKDATISPSAKKVLITKSKNIVNAQYTYDSIITSIKKNNALNTSSPIKSKDDEKEQIEFSKLTTLLYSVCTSVFIPNMKYIAIGSVMPNSGCYNAVKDTMMFLFNIKKISRTSNKVIATTTTIESPKETKRDDVIYDLEAKLKAQEKTIAELNERIDNKDNKIKLLKENYKKQIEVLKSSFGFNGDVNVLLSGDEYTKEARYAKMIREAKDTVRLRNKTISEMEEKMESLKEEIRKIKIETAVKENDMTMLKMFNNAKENKESKEKELKLSSEVSNTISQMQKRIDSLEIINKSLQAELDSRNKVIQNLPQLLRNKSDEKLKISQIKENAMKQYDTKKKKELADIVISNDKEMKILKEKYENIIKQKDININELTSAYSTLSRNYEYEVKTYSDELIRLDTMTMNIVKKYKAIFGKKEHNIATFLNLKENFESLLLKTANDINNINFPLLYKKLLSENKLEINNINTILSSKQRQETTMSHSSKSRPHSSMVRRRQTNEIQIEAEENTKTINSDIYQKAAKFESEVKSLMEVINRNKIAMNSMNRTIQKLQCENTILSSKLHSKEKNDKISFPIMTSSMNNYVLSESNNKISTTTGSNFRRSSRPSTAKNKLIQLK